MQQLDEASTARMERGETGAQMLWQAALAGTERPSGTVARNSRTAPSSVRAVGLTRSGNNDHAGPK